MNLLQYLHNLEAWSSSYEKGAEGQITQIRSGGPGSGRHAEVLEKYGYGEMTKARTGSTIYSHNKDSNDRVLVAGDGSWRHINKGSGSRASVGSNADDLERHLSGK